MASRTIMTQIFRASYVHLKEAFAHDPKDTPAFSVSAMFPKSGTAVIGATGIQFASGYQDIMQALTEVTTEEWGWAFDAATAPQMGIQFPPSFKDGDMMLAKDAAGNPIPGQIDPAKAGFVHLNMKSYDPVGTCDPTGTKDIAPGSIYSGAWVRAQIEVSAYTNKSQSRIIAIKLLNVQMCYDDESFGRGPAQAATSAFAGMAVANSNVQAGFGQQGAMAAVPTQPAPGVATPPPAVAQGVPTPPPVVAAPVTPPPAAPVATPPPAAPVTPPPAAPVAPAAAPAAPVTPPPPAAPVAPVDNSPVILNDDLKAQGHTYESMTAAGWTNETLIANGHGTANYLQPQA